MANGLNKVMLIGHVGKDPELKYMPSGGAVANFNIATNESYKDKTGKLVEKTEWHKVVVYARTAEVVAEYVKKGAQVFVEGKLQTRSWDKDGVKHYMTEIVAFNVQFLGSKKGGAVDGEAPATETEAQSAPRPEEDLPF